MRPRLPAPVAIIQLVAMALVTALASPVSAAELTHWTLDGGGGSSTAGSYGLRGTLGQWDAGFCAAGDIRLRGGFWPAGVLSTAVPEDGAPAVSRLLLPVPNPFNPRTDLAFDLASAGPVSMRIYDVSGRLQRVLLDEALPAGRHTAAWDGRDDAGHTLASGIYFVQLRAPGFAAVRKAVLVR